MKEKLRKLIKTFPGLPEGAGIYDDGLFYNCAPGQPSQPINHDNDVFYFVVEGQLMFDTTHPQYKNAKRGLRLAGVDIDNVKSANELEYLMSSNRYGESIAQYIQLKQQSRIPRTTFQRMIQARENGNSEEASRLLTLLTRRVHLGFKIISKN